jgi:hypothetical protein
MVLYVYSSEPAKVEMMYHTISQFGERAGVKKTYDTKEQCEADLPRFLTGAWEGAKMMVVEELGGRFDGQKKMIITRFPEGKDNTINTTSCVLIDLGK